MTAASRVVAEGRRVVPGVVNRGLFGHGSRFKVLARGALNHVGTSVLLLAF